MATRRSFETSLEKKSSEKIYIGCWRKINNLSEEYKKSKKKTKETHSRNGKHTYASQLNLE